MNKKQLWDLVIKSQLSEASTDLVKKILEGVKDEDEVKNDKLRTVSNILEAEEKANQTLADDCDKIIKELEKLN